MADKTLDNLTGSSLSHSLALNMYARKLSQAFIGALPSF